MAPEQFHQPILDFLRAQDGVAIRSVDIADRLNIAADDRARFEQAVDQLAAAGRLTVAAGRTLSLPAMGSRVVGRFSMTSRGFGFVMPDEANSHGDLFIPAGENMGAVSGDYVAAKVIVREKYDTRDPKKSISGRIVEIIRRATNSAVGVLTKQHNRWVVIPDGNIFKAPIEIQDVTAKSAQEGDKVVVELIRFPQPDEPGQGVITEVLGAHGEPEVELQSVIRQFDLPRDYPQAALEQARQAAAEYDPAGHLKEREDLTADLIVTIDPDDARDFDDAISLKILTPGGRRPRGDAEDEELSHLISEDGSQNGPAMYELGVHIADASTFVTPNSPLDMEARTRGNSIYFPRYVIPMLPEILSNGICSLQEGQLRLTKSAFIRYDAHGHVVGQRFANTVIKSAKRLTYKSAQAIIDDAKGEGQPYSKGLLEAPPNPNVPEVSEDVRNLLVTMDRVARIIRQRRLKAGMIVLDLPEVELVMDDDGRVIDARPEDDSFTHKIIEMFMVEANEAVARHLTKAGLAVLRRIHPDPDVLAGEQVRQFMMIAGKKLPKVLDRFAIQQLLDSVRGTPIAHTVHLAVLKTFSSAEYSPLDLGHYALASDNYAHFTSPIRRYADLVIHRALEAVLARRSGKKNKLEAKSVNPPALPSGIPGGRKGQGMMPDSLDMVPDYATLANLGKHLSFTERRAADAERELRAVKILQLLSEHIGDVIDGVVTGVTSFGVFVQSTRFLADGMIRVADLPDDFWQFDDRAGTLKGQRSGRRIALGDRCKVQIVAVNIGARQLDFRLLEHGSSVGGESTMRRMEPRKMGRGPQSAAIPGVVDGPEDLNIPSRRKNAKKRLERKQAKHQQRTGQAAPNPHGESGGRGRGRGRGRGKKKDRGGRRR